MEKPNFLQSDCHSILSTIKHEEKQIQLKRRWLLDLPSSEAGLNQSKKHKILQTRSLPESFLREDDIFYDTVKSCVEEAFGVRPVVTGNEVEVDKDGLEFLHMPNNITKVILSCVDNLTTKGLYLLAEILTEGRMEFVKTRWKMKKVVRESVSVIFGGQNYNRPRTIMEISGHLIQLLNGPGNFQDNLVPFFTSKSAIQQAAAMKVLNVLESFSTQILIAMYRKLKGHKRKTPQLLPNRCGWNREYLLNQVREVCKKMLSEIGKGDQLPEPLSKALAIACLALKLAPGFHNSSTTEFCQLSDEIKVLQNELIKAIWLVRTNVGLPELKNIKNLVDPNAKVSNKSLRKAIWKFLVEYLVQCSDLDSIPKSLYKTLSIINGKSRSTPEGFTLKEAIDEEVECILNVSAHAKQIFWDLLPAHDFDVDFTDAYMHDLSESDDDCGYVDDETEQVDDSKVESTGDFVPFNVNLPTVEDSRSVAPDERPEPEISTGVENADFSSGTANEMNDKQTTHKNQYIGIQEICDETSMFAYNLIGRMMEEFGQKEGLEIDWFSTSYLRGGCADKEDSQDCIPSGLWARPIYRGKNGMHSVPCNITEAEVQTSPKESVGATIVRVTEELLHSFPKSGMERLRKLMAL
ncbi:uncharacterized protein LOC133796527 [Humulus lupulus]|uniref:uncharacterized protein LOC133796527 n=1 Tax=Humulus lupulus TaxID=3486 RepID=UPI002B4154FE|nr:uncharacterized protein LOC133796527 [Humulus lupulus]XP_062090062.1 uncharacterized protein LOC133796527 [Humulus lupulus]